MTVSCVLTITSSVSESETAETLHVYNHWQPGHSHRQTDRQTDRQIVLSWSKVKPGFITHNRQTRSYTHTHTQHGYTHCDTSMSTCSSMGYVHRQTDRQTDRQTYRQTDRQTDTVLSWSKVKPGFITHKRQTRCYHGVKQGLKRSFNIKMRLISSIISRQTQNDVITHTL